MNATETFELLKKLIEIPSLSREEDAAAAFLMDHIKSLDYKVQREGNNLIVYSRFWDDTKKTILLNSHIDTVKASEKWIRNPYKATLEGEVLYGLGSNDAGASLVSLLATFVRLDKQEQAFNMIYLASCEEEISGKNGVESIVPKLPTIEFAIVGEPTQMHMAIAEKGLMVLDCVAEGKSGHAARNEGVNAIYTAMQDIEWFRSHNFPKVSDVLGSVKMSVTQINAGTQHNVVPDSCSFVVDVRSNEHYSNEELLNLIKSYVACKVTPRSLRLNSSSAPLDHPIVLKGLEIGRQTYGSPTTSDQALMPYKSFKMGPGDSARSHTADEYIKFSEIEEGIDIYFKVLNGLIVC